MGSTRTLDQVPTTPSTIIINTYNYRRQHNTLFDSSEENHQTGYYRKQSNVHLHHPQQRPPQEGRLS